MKVDVPEVMETVLVKCEKRRKNLSVGSPVVEDVVVQGKMTFLYQFITNTSHY